MHIRLFGRADCHLCDDAAMLLQAELQTHSTSKAWDRIDIDEDHAARERYALRIPVLVDALGRELDWPFDADDLRTWLKS